MNEYNVPYVRYDWTRCSSYDSKMDLSTFHTVSFQKDFFGILDFLKILKIFPYERDRTLVVKNIFEFRILWENFCKRERERENMSNQKIQRLLDKVKWIATLLTRTTKRRNDRHIIEHVLSSLTRIKHKSKTKHNSQHHKKCTVLRFR